MNNDISVNLIYHKIIMRQCGTKSQYSLIKKIIHDIQIDMLYHYSQV